MGYKIGTGGGVIYENSKYVQFSIFKIGFFTFAGQKSMTSKVWYIFHGDGRNLVYIAQTPTPIHAQRLSVLLYFTCNSLLTLEFPLKSIPLRLLGIHQPRTLMIFQ
jgi:hypothetical protein